MLKKRRSVECRRARITSVNPKNKLNREEFHSTIILPSIQEDSQSGKRVCVWVCVWNGASVATTSSVKMETDGCLHLANKTSSHLVKIGAYLCVNGKEQGGNAVKKSSPCCCWSDDVITDSGYRGNQSSWQVSQIHMNAVWNHWVRRLFPCATVSNHTTAFEKNCIQCSAGSLHKYCSVVLNQ